MNTKRWIVWIVPVMAIAVGCDRKAAKPAAPPAPVARVVVTPPPLQPPADPAVPRPATEPAQPVGVFMAIDQRMVDFPRVCVKVSPSPKGITALLYTADPPAAINDDYVGNSIYLSIPLTPAHPGEASIDGATWRFKAVSSDRPSNSSKYGIFLQGLRYRMEPQDVLVKFTGSGSELRVQMAGQFLMFDSSNRTELGAITPLSGDFTATLETNNPSDK